jgi:hypothetical protein
MKIDTEKCIITNSYSHFMIFELLDSGERVRVDVSEDEFKNKKGESTLHPEQVVIIVYEELRVMFILERRRIFS